VLVYKTKTAFKTIHWIKIRHLQYIEMTD